MSYGLSPIVARNWTEMASESKKKTSPVKKD